MLTVSIIQLDLLDGKGARDEVKFSLQHPMIALQIGSYSHGSTNISTNAVRFANNPGLALQENSQHEGSQVNAFRHTLWQATITAKFGDDIAKQVGDAHEDSPSENLNIRSFTGKNAFSQADQTIDLLNNNIGREIGKDNPGTTMQELATKTLDTFHNDELYTATINKDSSVIVTKTKLSDEQYKKGMETLKNFIVVDLLQPNKNRKIKKLKDKQSRLRNNRLQYNKEHEKTNNSDFFISCIFMSKFNKR